LTTEQTTKDNKPMAKVRLTVACGAYDIVKPLIEGTVEADAST
jgi:hypothetical protein